MSTKQSTVRSHRVTTEGDELYYEVRGQGDAKDFLAKQELLPVTNYLPDAERIKQNGVRVYMAVGEWALSRKTWHAQTAHILAEKLECPLVTFPGHHGSYMDMPDRWAATLRSVLHNMEVP